jgi:hypothetical protein
MKIKMPKIKIKNPIKVITHEVNHTIDKVEHIVSPVVDPVIHVIDDHIQDPVSKWGQTLAQDTQLAVSHTKSVCESQTADYAKLGLDVTSDIWIQGSTETVRLSSQGVDVVVDATEQAIKYLEENACYMGLNMALTLGCVEYFTPKPAPADPGTVASVAMSGTYLSWAATKGSQMVLATTLGALVTQGLMLIPGVSGAVDRKLLQRVLTNVIGTMNPTVLAVSLATPAGAGLFVASVVSPIVAQMVCSHVVPRGCN